ncbi:MAG TPA: hypothetical protein VLM89_16115 [Phycisphaerae bacterium]|nr:hypothetical protein [Phycisphaerae bacterium]
MHAISHTGKMDEEARPDAGDVDGVPVFEPLADAQVGEWARYGALDSAELIYRVVRAEAATVRTEVVVYEGGRPLGLPTVREDMRTWDPPASLARGVGARRIARRCTIEVAGRPWDALLYEDRWTDEGIAYLRRTWVSQASPVFGTLVMELHGDDALEARLELKAFGVEEATAASAETAAP